jgi:hypothetical protein
MENAVMPKTMASLLIGVNPSAMGGSLAVEKVWCSQLGGPFGPGFPTTSDLAAEIRIAHAKLLMMPAGPTGLRFAMMAPARVATFLLDLQLLTRRSAIPPSRPSTPSLA